jgi:hypothetical protein
MLINFQHMEGFGEPLRKVRNDDVETGFAAFEAAKLLYRSGTPLKFVTPIGSLGSDYDLLALPKGGGHVAVEAKCKLPSTAMKPRKIMRALSRARDQLPKQQPGVIMFRVPVHWAEKTDSQGPLARAADNILRSSDSLAGILIFSNSFLEASSSDGQPPRKASMIVAREFWSKRSEFANATEWRLCRSSIFDDAGWMSVAKLLDKPWLHLPPLQRGI